MALNRAEKPLAQAQLGAALGVVYAAPTSPQNAQAVIKSLWICNCDVSQRTVTLRYGAGALTQANSIFEAAAIPGNTTWFIEAADSMLTLVAGTALQGLSDVGGKVTVTVSGEEIL